MFLIQKFGNVKLERLYCFKQLQQHLTFLTYLLCTFTAALLLISLNHLANFDLTFVWATVSAGFALVLNIWFNVASIQYQKTIIKIFKIWLCSITFFAITTSGQHALLFCTISLFTIYTLLPLNFLQTLLTTAFLSLYQIILFVVLSLNNGDQHSIVEELLATVIVHIWANFIGIYILATRNRLSRASFLNARNALTSEQDANFQKNRMTSLLSASLPMHVIQSVQNQIHISVPKIYVEHYVQATVIYAKIYGLQNVLNQLLIQDSARLLNEFNYRIDQLIEGFNFIRIQSDAIVVVAGIPHSTNNEFAIQACYFGQTLVAIFRSFCDATTADVQIKVGISTGTIFSGIIGAKKWHYEIIGNAYDNAKSLESKAFLGTIFLSENTNSIVNKIFSTEKVDYNAWKILNSASLPNIFYQILNSLMFTNTQRRYSLIALPQTINLLLQSSAIASASTKTNCAFNKHHEIFKPNCVRGRRKRNYNKNEKSCDTTFNFVSNNNENLIDENNDLSQKCGTSSLFNPITLCFIDKQLEKNFYVQIDRWFIPALTIHILFFVIYGLYQMLTISRFFTTLIIITSAICVLFIILLILYVNFFENFCQFLTRTSFGYSITIFFIILIAFICGIVNTFFCDLYDKTQICHKVYYSAISCALWMLSTVVFIRFNSLKLLISIVCGILFYSIYVFKTHSNLYHEFFIKFGWQIEFDTIIGLLTLGLIIFLQSRQNERLLKIDYLSVLKTIEENNQRERFEYLNEQIIFNALPLYIARNYLTRNDLYQNFHQNVGVLSAQIGQTSDWQGEFGFDRLNKIVFEIDQILPDYIGLEKFRTAHAVYTCVVGLSPNCLENNVNDSTCTISDLLATLIKFALDMKTLVNKEGFEIAIGIDCGPALSLIIGNERPCFDLIGTPCTRALELLNFASKIKEFQQKSDNYNKSPHYKIIASEEIFLTLRLRLNNATYYFDEKNICTVAPGLVGYNILENENSNKVNHNDQSYNENRIIVEPKLNLQKKNLNSQIINNQFYDKDVLTNSLNVSQNLKEKFLKNTVNIRNNCLEKQKPFCFNDSTISLSTKEQNSKLNVESLQDTQLETKIKKECLPTYNKNNKNFARHSLAVVPNSIVIPHMSKEKSISNSMLLNKDNLNLNSLSSLPNSLQMSETDFDEIDEHVAAEVCAREQQFLNKHQNNICNNNNEDNINNCLFNSENKLFNLPTDLKALAMDKRLSGYISDSKNKKDQSFVKNQNYKRLAHHNPLEMFSSINSSFSSELFSIDISVESDSEIEWIRPEMIAALNNKNNKCLKPLNCPKILSQLSINKENSNFFLSKLIKSRESSQNGIYQQYSKQSSKQNSFRSNSFSSKLQRKRYCLSRNGPKPPNWFSQNGSRTSFNSQFSMLNGHIQKKSTSALDRLNVAADRVNKMLQELASVDSTYSNNKHTKLKDCVPFPIISDKSLNPLIKFKRESLGSPKLANNSACQTDYDNAESEDFYSDSELMTVYRQQEIRNDQFNYLNNNIEFNPTTNLLKKEKNNFDKNNSFTDKNHNKLNGFPPLPPSAQNFASKRKRFKQKKSSHGLSSAYEADIDSNCSSVASSSMFLNAKNRILTSFRKSPANNIKWKSVHSIGYDNEYEYAVEDDYGSSEFDNVEINLEAFNQKNIKINNVNTSLLGAFDPILLARKNNLSKKDATDLNFIAMDANESEDEKVNCKSFNKNSKCLALSQIAANNFEKNKLAQNILDARGQVHAISADICKNFGNFQLSSFSDAEI